MTGLNRFLIGSGVAVAIGLGAVSLGAEIPLDQELQQLSVPDNQLVPSADTEKLYAIQTRYAPLANRHEITLGGAKNFTADSHLTSQQLDLTYRFHINDKWYVGLAGSYVFNSFTDAANRLISQQKLVPDIAYPKFRGDLLVGYNLFYGKFRLSMDTVFYFDQYIALGPGLVNLNTGTTPAAVADIGFVFWLGKGGSMRLGLKDYFFKETRVRSSGMVHNLLAHLDVGIVLGK